MAAHNIATKKPAKMRQKCRLHACIRAKNRGGSLVSNIQCRGPWQSPHPATSAEKIGDRFVFNYGGSPVSGRCGRGATVARVAGASRKNTRNNVAKLPRGSLGERALPALRASLQPLCRNFKHEWEWLGVLGILRELGVLGLTAAPVVRVPSRSQYSQYSQYSQHSQCSQCSQRSQRSQPHCLRRR
jgi:hypothetical protein